MQIVRRSEQEPSLFEVYFVRQTTKCMHPPPEECLELWPLEPITGLTAPETRDKALPLLEVAAAGCEDERFEIRDRPIPIHRKRVKEVESATHRALAWIYQHSETRYEVRYFGAIIGCDYEDGWRLSAPPVEDMPVPSGSEVLTLADSLESAEQIAMLELEAIVGPQQIKPRQS